MSLGIVHRSLNIEAALKNVNLLSDTIEADGRILRKKCEIKRYLKRQLKAGRKYLPICDCDNFDYQRGCLGHDEL